MNVLVDSIEPMMVRRKFCCRSIRPKSPFARPCRVRTYCRAFSPLSVCQPLVPGDVLGAVVERLGDVDADTTEGVGQALEPVPVDHRDVVDVHAGEVLDGAYGERRSAPGEGGVDLGLAVDVAGEGGHRDPGVTRDRDDLRGLPVGRDVHQDDRVAAVQRRASRCRRRGRRRRSRRCCRRRTRAPGC